LLGYRERILAARWGRRGALQSLLWCGGTHCDSIDRKRGHVDSRLLAPSAAGARWDSRHAGDWHSELIHTPLMPSSTASTNEPEVSVLRRAPSVGSAMRCSQASTETWWGGIHTQPTAVIGQHRVARRAQRVQVRTSTTDTRRPTQTFTRVHPPRGTVFACVILQVVLNMRISLSECAREETPHTTSWSDCVEGFHTWTHVTTPCLGNECCNVLEHFLVLPVAQPPIKQTLA
jgi:hypothetical protein